MVPTDAGPEVTRPKLVPPVARVSYRPVLTVEREMVRVHLARTEGSAHQLLLRLRALLPRVYQAFIAVRAFERLAWFDAPADTVRNGRPVPALGEALAKKARVDGLEDGELTMLAQALEDPRQARATLQLTLRERAAADDLIAAICATFGWTP